MTWQLDAFVAHLRRLWPDTHETAGWRTRNNRSTWQAGGPVGIMNHHTVSNPAEAPGPAVQRIISGWSGLPGPIYGALVVTSGAVHLIAGGPANHAGNGVGRVLDRTRAGQAPLGDAAAVYGRGTDTMSGNRWYFSVSGQHRGTHPDWPARQLEGIAAVNAAFHLARGFTSARTIHHREWTSRNIDMSWRGDLRSRVAALMAGGQTPPAIEGVDDMPVVILSSNAPRPHLFLSGNRAIQLTDGNSTEAFRAARVPVVAIPAADWDRLRQFYEVDPIRVG